jgi:hypothetical protein
MTAKMDYKYKRNSSAFDVLTPESAYWIGFLYGDGSCTQMSRIQLVLSQKDEEALIGFRNFIQCIEKPIKHFVTNCGHPSCSFEIRDWRMIKALSKYSLNLRKNKRGLIHISLLQPDVVRDFIRGLFDADGCFYYDGLHKNNLFAEITGYKPAMKSLKSILTYYQVINEHKNLTRNGSIWRIRFPKDACLKLIRFLYEGNPRYYLKRKYGIAKNYLDRLNETHEVTVETYLRPVSQFNKGKQSEFNERKWFTEDKAGVKDGN